MPERLSRELRRHARRCPAEMRPQLERVISYADSMITGTHVGEEWALEAESEIAEI
jgi:hypothetical protein